MHDLRGSLEGEGLRVAIAVSRYNETVTRGLLRGALDVLEECHVASDDVTVVHVPGALELPLMCSLMAGSGEYDAVIALGAVIQGETDHYEHVCRETLHGCGLAALDTLVPVLCGVLTCATLAQARDRSTTPAKNKGCEVARAAIETANVVRGWENMLPDPEDPANYEDEDEEFDIDEAIDELEDELNGGDDGADEDEPR